MVKAASGTIPLSHNSAIVNSYSVLKARLGSAMWRGVHWKMMLVGSRWMMLSPLTGKFKKGGSFKLSQACAQIPRPTT